MNPEQQQIAIATACGWTEIEDCTCHASKSRGFEPTPGAHKKHIPDYLNDLNAMQCAEKYASENYTSFSWKRYRTKIEIVMDEEGMAHISTAAQRAEAFLRTLNLWTE